MTTETTVSAPAAPSPKKAAGGPQTPVFPSLPSDNKPLTDLTIYTVAQLTEMRDRQQHLLSNKKRLATLPDKGARIRALHQRVCDELGTRDAVQQASDLFSALNIAATGKRMTTQMEWNGRQQTNGTSSDAAEPQVDDEETGDERNPLKLLAQSRHTSKVVQVEAPVESLITEADRQQIAEFALESKSAAGAAGDSNASSAVDLEPHAVYMCSIDQRHTPKRERFLPHKTTVKHETTASKSPRPPGKHWENTAATFPVLRNQAVVALSLQDSIEVQRKQLEALKSIELQNATERLRAHEELVAKLQAERSQLDDGTLPASLFGTYRTTSSAAAALDSDDDEENDRRSVDSDSNSTGEEGDQQHDEDH